MFLCDCRKPALACQKAAAPGRRNQPRAGRSVSQVIELGDSSDDDVRINNAEQRSRQPPCRVNKAACGDTLSDEAEAEDDSDDDFVADVRRGRRQPMNRGGLRGRSSTGLPGLNFPAPSFHANPQPDQICTPGPRSCHILVCKFNLTSHMQGVWWAFGEDVGCWVKFEEIAGISLACCGILD